MLSYPMGARAQSGGATKGVVATLDPSGAVVMDWGVAGREACWREDLEVMKRELPRRQKDFEKLMPRAEFERQVSALEASITNWTDAELMFGVMRLVAGLGVAHSVVSTAETPLAGQWHQNLMGLKWFADGLVVVQAPEEYQATLGKRVVSIGGRTPQELESKLAQYIPHENLAWLRVREPSYLSITEMFQALQAAGADGATDYVLEDTNGVRSTVSVRSRSLPEARKVKMVSVMNVLQIPRPPYLKNVKKHYWCEWLGDSRTLYIQYNVCGEDKKLPFADFTEQVRELATTNAVARVVVDLRWNAGGNSAVMSPLTRLLKKNAEWSGPGRLYVVIGGETFSSGVINALELRDELQAVMVGEPTGGKPNGYGEVSSFKLPNTQLDIEFTTKYFNLEPNDAGAWVMPEILAPCKWSDFLAGRDPAMEKILEAGKNKK